MISNLVKLIKYDLNFIHINNVLMVFFNKNDCLQYLWLSSLQYNPNSKFLPFALTITCFSNLIFPKIVYTTIMLFYFDFSLIFPMCMCIMTSSQRNIIKELSCTTDRKAIEMVKETSSGLRVKLSINSGLHIFSHKNPIKYTTSSS